MFDAIPAAVRNAAGKLRCPHCGGTLTRSTYTLDVAVRRELPDGTFEWGAGPAMVTLTCDECRRVSTLPPDQQG